MKTYLGTKLIWAVSMNREAYNMLRGWKLPADENGADEGFLVEYIDGGAANVPGYAGYISWSPKGVFEQSYREIDDLPIDLYKKPPYQVRVLIEAADLRDKTRKLFDFIHKSGLLGKLPQREQRRLTRQWAVMNVYLEILDERIAAFE